MTTKTRFVDFDQLVYLNFEHSPGYAQWWVMLNLGQAKVGESSAVKLQGFGARQAAENFKQDIYYDCIKPRHGAENEVSDV